MSVSPSKIARLRKKAGLSQKQLADKLQVSGITVFRWENGINAPEPDTLIRLLRVLENKPRRSHKTVVVRTRKNGLVGSTLREARINLELSIRDLEDKTGIPGPTISRIESGKIKNPKPEKIELIRSALGIGAGFEKSKKRVLTRPKKQVGANSDIASWLLAAMTSQGLTPKGLATKTGLSLDSIKRILAGKTQNLQSKTRSRLEHVIGKMPREVIDEAQQDSEVIGLGILEDFDPHNEHDRPDHPGIYVFYDISERPVYVGMGGNIKVRIKHHEEKFWFKRPILESASSIRIDDEKLRGQVEQVLIKFLKSNAVINKQGVQRDE